VAVLVRYQHAGFGVIRRWKIVKRHMNILALPLHIFRSARCDAFRDLRFFGIFFSVLRPSTQVIDVRHVHPLRTSGSEFLHANRRNSIHCGSFPQSRLWHPGARIAIRIRRLLTDELSALTTRFASARGAEHFPKRIAKRKPNSAAPPAEVASPRTRITPGHRGTKKFRVRRATMERPRATNIAPKRGP